MFIWLLLLVMASGYTHCSEDLGSELGMKEAPSKRRPSEADRVTIDLSALRPSLPGLVLYDFGGGEAGSPKLVQVDLSALNPRLQPHVIWPQFSEMDLLDERPFELETLDAIPYLTEEESPLSHPRRMAKMSHWFDTGSRRNDAYDFVPDSQPQQNKLLSLHGSLPLADEVIVPLDWEEKDKIKKRNIFVTKGWKPGGGSGSPTITRSSTPNFATYYARVRADRKQMRRRETESEEKERGGRGSRDIHQNENVRQQVRVPGQESWSLPQQYWNVPHLFGNEWQ